MRRRLFLTLACLLVVLIGIGAFWVQQAQAPSAADAPLPDLQPFDLSAAFTFEYPTDWAYNIPQLNLLVTAPAETLRGRETGPSVTIQRVALPLQDSLEIGLNAYLEAGPLASDDGWQIGPIETRSLGENPALSVWLQSPADDTNPQMCLEIFYTKAQNLFPYIITSSAPLDDCATYEALFTAIVASVEIRE